MESKCFILYFQRVVKRNTIANSHGHSQVTALVTSMKHCVMLLFLPNSMRSSADPCTQGLCCALWKAILMSIIVYKKRTFVLYKLYDFKTWLSYGTGQNTKYGLMLSRGNNNKINKIIMK